MYHRGIEEILPILGTGTVAGVEIGTEIGEIGEEIVTTGTTEIVVTGIKTIVTTTTPLVVVVGITMEELQPVVLQFLHLNSNRKCSQRRIYSTNREETAGLKTLSSYFVDCRVQGNPTWLKS